MQRAVLFHGTSGTFVYSWNTVSSLKKFTLLMIGPDVGLHFTEKVYTQVVSEQSLLKAINLQATPMESKLFLTLGYKQEASLRPVAL